MQHPSPVSKCRIWALPAVDCWLAALHLPRHFNLDTLNILPTTHSIDTFGWTQAASVRSNRLRIMNNANAINRRPPDCARGPCPGVDEVSVGPIVAG